MFQNQVKRVNIGDRCRRRVDLIIVEDLECVIQDRLNDTDLPPGVGDVAAGIGAH